MHNRDTTTEPGTPAAPPHDRDCMVRAQSHLNRAMRAVDQGRYPLALRHIVASRKNVEIFVAEGGEPCAR